MDEKLFKVIFVGDLRVGKTSFIIKFTQNKFSPNYKATLGSKALLALECEMGRSGFCRPSITNIFRSGLHHNRSSTDSVRSYKSGSKYFA